MEKLYKNIRARRIELGYTQQELADKMEYTNRSTISKIENGLVDLSQSNILQFAEALETTPGKLMGDVDPDESDSQSYYENEETAELARKYREHPKLKALFDLQSDMNPDDLEVLYTMARRLKEKEDEGNIES